MDPDPDPDPGGPKTRGSGDLNPDSDLDPQHCSYVHIEFFLAINTRKIVITNFLIS